jgi:RNA polymerase sigma factor (sigma-70 family)
MQVFQSAVVEKISDADLVAAVKRGDTQAFEHLFLRHQQKVLLLVQRITNNREDAEDVAQESFHKAFLHLGDFEEKARFSTWLTRIAINEAYMLLRRRRKMFDLLPENPDDEMAAYTEAFVDRNPNPEEYCWQRERSNLLNMAVNRLGLKIRKTIRLRDLEERSVEETARLLGTSKAAVKARVFHGRRKLRRTVNPALLWETSSSCPRQAQPWG